MSGCQASLSYKRNAHGGGCEHKKETLEMRASFIKLQRELERSEQRDQALTKELRATRASMQESQRDLHTFKTVFEKTNAERKYLASQLQEQKEKNSKLEIQITRMDRSCQLILDLDASKTENKRLLAEMEKQDAIVQSVRDKEQSQLREIEALNRSLDACVFYQGGQQQREAVSGEKLREIYYELGKRQADIHALSLSLSQVNTQLEKLTHSHKELERVQSTSEVEMKHVKEYNDQLLQNSITTAKEMAALEKEVVGLRGCNTKLQEEISTLMDKLKTSMLASNEMQESNEEHISSLTATIADLQESKHHLTERLEALTLSLRHRESVLALTEKRLEVESQRLQEDRQSLAESTKQGEAHSSQIQMLRSNMTNALHANEILARESREMAGAHREAMEALHQRCLRAETLAQEQADQAKVSEEQLREMASEREEMVAAFKKSIATAKGLSARLVQEQARSESLKQQLQNTEQSMQQIIKAKEQVSYAVLDALYKERSQHTDSRNNVSYSYEESPRRSIGMTPSTHTHTSSSSYMNAHDENPEHTPTSRPPLKHPLVNSSSYEGGDHSAATTSSPLSTQSNVYHEQYHVPPQQHQHFPPTNRGESAYQVSGWKGGEEKEHNSDMQEDFLNDSLDSINNNINNQNNESNDNVSGIIFNSRGLDGATALRGDLQRLRREVDLLEKKSLRTTNSLDYDSTDRLEEEEGGSESSGGSARSKTGSGWHDKESSAVNNTTHSLCFSATTSTSSSSGTTASYLSSQIPSRNLSDTNKNHQEEHSESQAEPPKSRHSPPSHSLFDLVDLDPRVAFEHSQPPSPCRSLPDRDHDNGYSSE